MFILCTPEEELSLTYFMKRDLIDIDIIGNLASKSN